MKMAMLCLLLVFLVALPFFCPMQGSDRDPVSHETATRQARPRLAGEKFDPQESDPQLRSIFAAVDAEAERVVGNANRDGRFIFRFWSVKKRMLRRKHRIDWKTPAELNPSITYDSYGRPRVTPGEIREITSIIEKQMHHRGEKIAYFERTFDGSINVWTKVDNREERGRYVVRTEDHTWKIINYYVVLP
jgi:hypothetical protein